MKKNHPIPFFLIALAMLSGCANYKAAPLTSLSSEAVPSFSNSTDNKDVVVSAKIYDKMDCEKYLGRDVISKGYQPIQLYIQNNSDKSYAFSLNRINLPYAKQEEVAEKVHTSTIGRVLGYGIPGLVVFWPLIIPAIVDGIKSSDANEALDCDFSSKIAKDQTINSYSHFNKIIFVPISEFQSSFNVTLIDMESNKPNTFHIRAG